MATFTQQTKLGDEAGAPSSQPPTTIDYSELHCVWPGRDGAPMCGPYLSTKRRSWSSIKLCRQSTNWPLPKCMHTGWHSDFTKWPSVEPFNRQVAALSSAKTGTLPKSQLFMEINELLHTMYVQPVDIGWPTGNGKKLSCRQAQLGQATWLAVA